MSDPGGTSKQLSELTVYIWNMSEDVWPFIDAMTSKKERELEIAENANLGDRELFSLAGTDNIIFISPKPLSNIYLSYVQSITKSKHIRVLIPDHHSGVICEDILNDDHLLSELETLISSSSKVTFLSYTTSWYFLHLVNTLREKNLLIETPEAPREEDAWTVNFFGSKSGFRQFAQQNYVKEPDFLTPDGLICMGIEDAARIAAKKYSLLNGVVIKTNKGHSGAGVLIFAPGDLERDYKTCERLIYQRLAKDSYWKKFPIIIEDYIQVNPLIAGGFPNAEFKIHKNGKIDFLFYCGMFVDNKGIFQGQEIYQETMPQKIAVQLTDTGFFIAEQYAKAGYRGYFDVDCIMGKNGKLYVSESNVRRTGGTYLYEIVEYLFGKEFMYKTYALSNSVQLKKGINFTFEQLLHRIEPLLFDQKKSEGVIIVSENLLSQGKVAYIVIAPNKKRALQIVETFRGTLETTA